jgi:AcrR family transcriptional regulator
MRQPTTKSGPSAYKTTMVVAYGKRKGRERTRIDATGWVDAGLEILRTESIEHVKVERLAARLGISKGSFYWHFRNKADLHAAILQRWKDHSLIEVVEALEKPSIGAPEKLKRLLELSFWSADIPRAADLDLAIRAWARRFAPARLAVARFDAMRIDFIQNIFLKLGFGPKDAKARAHLAYPFIRYLNHSNGMSAAEKRRVIRLGYACLVSGVPTGRKKRAQPQ